MENCLQDRRAGRRLRGCVCVSRRAGPRTRAQKAPFLYRNYAHRGLHTEDGTVPENSLPAFRAAAEAGYAVEMDVHLTADDQLVVFHDDTLERMCGVRA